jgi:hypothetical protein
MSSTNSGAAVSTGPLTGFIGRLSLIPSVIASTTAADEQSDEPQRRQRGFAMVNLFVAAWLSQSFPVSSLSPLGADVRVADP